MLTTLIWVLNWDISIKPLPELGRHLPCTAVVCSNRITSKVVIQILIHTAGRSIMMHPVVPTVFVNTQKYKWVSSE